MFRFTVALLVVTLVAGFACAEPVTKTFGKAPTLTEATAISKLNAEPNTFVDKDVLITGKVVDVCQAKGCWLEVEAADSSRILCKSFGDKVVFPKDVVGKMIHLQGKLVLDAKKPEHAEKAEKSAESPKAELAVEKMNAKTEAKEEAKEAKEEAKEGAKAEKEDAKESAMDEAKEAKMAPHACPVQKVMISIEGATVQYADAK